MVDRGGTPGDRDGACPWLVDGLCGNREGRALACRTYFCSDEEEARAATERWHREVRRIHDECGLRYEYRAFEDLRNPGPRVPSKDQSL